MPRMTMDALVASVHAKIAASQSKPSPALRLCGAGSHKPCPRLIRFCLYKRALERASTTPRGEKTLRPRLIVHVPSRGFHFSCFGRQTASPIRRTPRRAQERLTERHVRFGCDPPHRRRERSTCLFGLPNEAGRGLCAVGHSSNHPRGLV